MCPYNRSLYNALPTPTSLPLAQLASLISCPERKRLLPIPFFSSRELLARLGIVPYWTNAKAGPVTHSFLPLAIVKHKRLVRLLPFPSRELLARPRYRALFNIRACYAFLPSPPANFSRVPVSRPTEQMRKGLSRFLVQCTSHAFNCCQKNILLLLFYSWSRGTHKTWQLRRTKNRVIATTTKMKMKKKMQR